MFDMKAKLVEILGNTFIKREGVAKVESTADYLLANGVIKVVRCKDCEFVEPTKIKLNGKDLRICGLYKRPCFDNDFCSRGVLKE